MLEQKLDELETENTELKKIYNQIETKGFQIKLSEASMAYEEAMEMYSNLSKCYIELKKKESVTFEKYVEACQEREKALVDSQMEISHLHMKIKLLEEVLTRRNAECKEIPGNYSKNVSLSFVVGLHWE